MTSQAIKNLFENNSNEIADFDYVTCTPAE